MVIKCPPHKAATHIQAHGLHRLRLLNGPRRGTFPTATQGERASEQRKPKYMAARTIVLPRR